MCWQIAGWDESIGGFLFFYVHDNWFGRDGEWIVSVLCLVVQLVVVYVSPLFFVDIAGYRITRARSRSHPKRSILGWSRTSCSDSFFFYKKSGAFRQSPLKSLQFEIQYIGSWTQCNCPGYWGIVSFVSFRFVPHKLSFCEGFPAGSIVASLRCYEVPHKLPSISKAKMPVITISMDHLLSIKHIAVLYTLDNCPHTQHRN